MVELMCAHRHLNVVGIGMDCEVHNPPEKFSEAYALAKKAGLKTTAHAGEFGTPWKNVETALDVLGVDQLDPMLHKSLTIPPSSHVALTKES